MRAKAYMAPSRREAQRGAWMLIAILNQSSLVSDADAATMTQAVARLKLAWNA